MNLLRWMYRSGSAPIARDRLKVLLAHERKLGDRSDLVIVLRDEILAVIYRHMVITPDKVHMKMDRGGAMSTLAIDIEIPT